jgi:hypothetical protein
MAMVADGVLLTGLGTKRRSGILPVMNRARLGQLCVAILLVACSNDVNEGTGGPGAGGSGASGAAGPATTSTGAGGTQGQWETIITADWQLGPGSENTNDYHTQLIDEDIYVGAIRPIAPVGTHHTVLAMGDLGAGHIIYASGVDTDELHFPPGIGMRLPAGQQLVLQLHIFNASGQPLSGTSGIEVLRMDPADLEEEANVFLPGPTGFQIPPNSEHTDTGTCTVQQAMTAFAVLPHMHQLGSHLKTTLTLDGQDQVIHDGPYDFEHQVFTTFEPIALSPGDTITTECTWNNTTMGTVGWGESSLTEMCFSILYRYPALSDGGPFGFCEN